MPLLLWNSLIAKTHILISLYRMQHCGPGQCCSLPVGKTCWIDIKMSTVFVMSTVDIKLTSSVGIKLMSHIDIYLTIQLDVNLMLTNLMYEHEINRRKIIHVCISIQIELNEVSRQASWGHPTILVANYFRTNKSNIESELILPQRKEKELMLHFDLS